jgi:hypothetical protein
MTDELEPRAPDPDPDAWRRYLELNLGFGDPFIVQLSHRGFFSEVNVLADAVIYGLCNRRRLMVSPTKFNDLRWSDYFASELPTARMRAEWDLPEVSRVRTRSALFMQLLNWMDERRNGRFQLAGLEFEGDLFQVRRRLYAHLCPPADAILREAGRSMAEHGLQQGGFAAIHVRRGDKTRQRLKAGRMWSEGEDIPISSYIDLVARHAPHAGELFVLTDDHSAVEELAAVRPGYRVVSLCPEGERGHDQASFTAASPEQRRASIRRLAVETEIAARSGFFAGGYRSNIARYIATVHRQPERCISADGQTSPWGRR